MKNTVFFIVKRDDFYIQAFKRAEDPIGVSWHSDPFYAKRYTSKKSAEKLAAVNAAEVKAYTTRDFYDLVDSMRTPVKGNENDNVSI